MPPLLHPSISELALHIGITPPVLCQCIRKGQPCRGVRYYYREDWTGEEPVPVEYNAAPPQEEPASRAGKPYRLKDAAPRRKEERGPDLQGLEGGLKNTPEMIAFVQACREELREGLPAVIYKQLKETRRLSNDGRTLTIRFVLNLPKSGIFMSDRAMLFRLGWSEERPEENIRYVNFIKAKRFNVEGIA